MTKDALRQLIATALQSRQQYVPILRYDRNQPRGAKGSRQGGRWVKGVSAGSGGGTDSPTHVTRVGPLGPVRMPVKPSVAPGMERGPDIAEAAFPPHGTGFQNNPRGMANVRGDVSLARAYAADNAEKEAVAADAAARAAESGHSLAMIEGTVSGVNKKFSGGVNSSYLLSLEHPNGSTVKAVYKPESGEAWSISFCNDDITHYLTNRDFSLAEREEMAYEVSQGLGFDFVPETHLRTELEVEGIETMLSEDEGGYDEDYAREQYDEYKEKRQEQAMEQVGEEMYNLYLDAQQEHVDDIKNRADELQEIWDEEKENFPDNSQYGSMSAQREHPTLPVGSKQFERKELLDPVDPLEILNENGIDADGKMNTKERERARLAIREALEAGHRELAEVDEDAAREDLKYDDWLEGHSDTERRLYDDKIQSFTSWRHSQGMDSGAGGVRVANRQAPHPNGGSLQRYVRGLQDDGDLTHEDATKMAVLDYVLGTMDRHDNNLKFTTDLDGEGNEVSRPVAIDNGYSMPGPDNGPDNFYFRSGAVAAWMANADHHRVPESTRVEITKALESTDWKAMVARHPSMSKEERSAFLGRIERMKEALSYDEGLSTLWHDQNLMKH